MNHYLQVFDKQIIDCDKNIKNARKKYIVIDI